MDKIILQAHDLFKTAGFDYAICGGYGLDMFANQVIREHGDFDILVFDEDKRRAAQFMLDNGWLLFGRFGEHGAVWQYLFYKVNDLTDSFWDDCPNFWAIKPDCLPQVLQKIDRIQGDVYTYQTRKWHVQDEIEFIEIGFDTRENGEYIARANPKIALPMDNAIMFRNGIPYLAPEVTLLYKTGKASMESAYARPRTEADFAAIMPLLSAAQKDWLLKAINTAYPDGYEWLDGLLK